MLKTEEYCDANKMQINNKKTKLMVFNNPCIAWDFLPEMSLDGHDLAMVEELK